MGFVRADKQVQHNYLPLVIALPPKHRLASKLRVSLSALENEPFILVPRDAVPVFHDAVLKACRAAGFVPHAPHEADQLQMMIGMVAAGAGVALVPAAARKIKQYRLVYRPVRPSPDNLETAVAWRRDDASPILAEFLGAARRVLARRAAARTARDTAPFAEHSPAKQDCPHDCPCERNSLRKNLATERVENPPTCRETLMFLSVLRAKGEAKLDVPGYSERISDCK